MDLHNLLVGVLVWAIYPIWLAAGFLDYLSHRWTHIDRTTGPTESWFHLAEFASLALPLFLVTILQVTPLVIPIVAGSVFRDMTGQAILRSAVRTHMGCVVGWNTAEQTWDCPCHGSRVKPAGDVISGPAEAPLSEIK